MGDSPSNLLSRAADLIRDAGAHFATYHADLVLPDGTKRFDSPLDEWMYWNTDRTQDNGPALDWIRLLNPAVAPALERALRHEAGLHRLFTERGDPFYGPSPLLEFARVILGEEEDHAEAS